MTSLAKHCRLETRYSCLCFPPVVKTDQAHRQPDAEATGGRERAALDVERRTHRVQLMLDVEGVVRMTVDLERDDVSVLGAYHVVAA